MSLVKVKLPRLRKTAALAAPAAAAAPVPATPAPPVLLVTAYARSGLPEEAFSAQTAALRGVLEFDGGSRTWYALLPLDQPGRAAAVLNGLFEAARAHGTGIRVQAQPGESAPAPAAGPGTAP